LEAMPDDVASWESVSEGLRRQDRVVHGVESIAELVRATRDEHRVPALAFGVFREGSVLHEQLLGVADIAKLTPLGENPIFRAGSVNKVITSLAILRLVQAGALALDDPVSEHLRAFVLEPFDPADPPITLRHVLSHVAGLPRHQGDPRAGSLAEMVGGALRAVAPPAQRRVYSNIGFGMLGQLIEDVTGMPYRDRVASDVFEPLGMTRSSISADGAAATVVGYQGVGDLLYPVRPEAVVEEGAGAMCTTLADLARLATMLCRAGEGFLDRSLLDEAMTPSPVPRDDGPPGGLGFALFEIDREPIVWHNGGLAGWKAAWYVAPRRDVAVIGLASRFDAPLDRLARQVLTDVLGS